MKNLFNMGYLVFIAAILSAGSSMAGEKNDSNFAPASLYLRGIENAAEVFINDKPVTWVNSKPILTPPGYLHIQVGNKGTVIKKSFLIRPNESKIFNFAANPDYGAIDVISKPLGASVSLDGKRLGVTPFLDSTIAPGLVSVALEKYGYDPIRKELNLLPQEVLELTYEMKHTKVWLDSVSKAKIKQRKKIIFVQRVLFSVTGLAFGGVALYFDRTAQNNITAANNTANAYDKANGGFQGYKDSYSQSRKLATKNIARRDIASAIAAGAAAGFAITLLF